MARRPVGVPTPRAPEPAGATREVDWARQYATTPYDQLPWYSPHPGRWLVEAVAQRWIRPPGPILDIGCGAGSNALWLSQNRFRVTGIDLAPVAIDVARRRASKARSRAEFTVGNILATSYPDTAFAGALDSGCFHSLPVSDRGRYAAEVARLLAPGGSLVITWIGREETGEFGPPHRPSLAEVTSILEPSFIFASTEYAESGSPRAWSAKGHRLCRYTGRLIRRRTPQPSAR